VDQGHFKLGAYATSGDVLGQQEVFAGLAVAPANLDRDLFAEYQYRGWRPTLFLDVYYQVRHSARRDSSAANDFVVTGVDYDLMQASVGLRHQPSRRTEVIFSATYDRYDGSLKWRAPVSGTGLGSRWEQQRPFGYTYLNGFDLGLTYTFADPARRRDSDINPRGRRIWARYDRLFNYFMEGFDEDATFIKEKYLHLFYNQLTLDWQEYVGLPWSTTLGLRFYGGWITSSKVDSSLVNSFFDYHLGGLTYMKGYTFYSVEGRKAAMATATFRFPLLADRRWQVAHLYLERVYGALYGGAGKAWDRHFSDPDPFYGRKGPLRDVGGQVRLDLISYYSVPTRVEVDAARGIDEVAGRSPWKYYLTVLFGYP
ncbi:MAG: hypothetical protein AB1505_33270, partial [Candidatus Latescibacterota bacterium]